MNIKIYSTTGFKIFFVLFCTQKFVSNLNNYISKIRLLQYHTDI